MFDVTRHTVTIIVVREPLYRPTKTELAAIRKGEAAIVRGEYAALTDLPDDMERRRRKAGAKRPRKIPR
jgi:hypothetical protein